MAPSTAPPGASAAHRRSPTPPPASLAPATSAPTTPARASPAPAIQAQPANKSATPSSKAAKPPLGAQTNVLRNVTTSFKQKTHAKAAGSKFKAAYNGAGPAIVNIVENAAAYFEGKNNPEVLVDQARSYARYQFNVDLLNEIFDGPVAQRDDGTALSPVQNNLQPNGEANGDGVTDDGKKSLLFRDIARRVIRANAKEQAEEMQAMEKRFHELEEDMQSTETMNMRLFQRVERAETPAQIDALKNDLKRDYGINIAQDPPPIKRRMVDKSLPRLTMNDSEFRIVSFKSL